MKQVIYIILLLTVGFLLSTVGCTSDADFRKGARQLELQGYTEIENTGYSMWCCSDEDTYSTGFEATDKDGEIVTGCFCSSWGKGVTIRFE